MSPGPPLPSPVNEAPVTHPHSSVECLYTTLFTHKQIQSLFTNNSRTLPHTGNIDCEGEGIVEQAEFCHYSSEYREECGPPAQLLLEGINISAARSPNENTTGLGNFGLCSCQFDGGRRTCLQGLWAAACFRQTRDRVHIVPPGAAQFS